MAYHGAASYPVEIRHAPSKMMRDRRDEQGWICDAASDNNIRPGSERREQRLGSEISVCRNEIAEFGQRASSLERDAIRRYAVKHVIAE